MPHPELFALPPAPGALDPRLAWLAFHLVFVDNRWSAWKVFSRLRTPDEIFAAGPAGLAALGLPPKAAAKIASGRALEDAKRELDRLEKKGYALLTFGEDEYPEPLRRIADPPPVLFTAGRTAALQGPAVALVGARRPTPYGRAVADRLSADLAARGLVVVSGFARGIDSFAHWGALKAGRTAAVLGCGLNVVYPRENRALYDKIREAGAVATEFPLGTPPLARHFPLRNRIISGLCLALVVVEAAERSGSLITAGLGLEQGREVLAVPGNVTSPLSRGTNSLIRDGAKPVQSWEDVAEELPPPWREEILSRRDEGATRPPSLNRPERAVVQCLAADAVVHVDELAERTELAISELLALLLGLELKGAVVRHPGQYYQRRI